MSITETIVAFAVKQALDKAAGGPMPIVTAYHKTHFVLLVQVLREAERDGKIQDSLREIRENLQAFLAAGNKMLAGIPDDPVPPEVDIAGGSAAELSEQMKAFGEGLKNVIERLGDYIALAKEIEARTEKDLAALEKKLDRKGAASADLRTISNASRKKEMDLIRLTQMKQLREVRSRAETRLKSYQNV